MKPFIIATFRIPLVGEPISDILAKLFEEYDLLGDECVVSGEWIALMSDNTIQPYDNINHLVGEL